MRDTGAVSPSEIHRRLISWAIATVAAIATGCGGAGAGVGDDSAPDAGAADAMATFPPAPSPLPSSFPPENVLADDMIFGGEAISTAQVQDFLTIKGSFLATYTTGGRTGAQLIVELARDHGVNPLYMLARIQTESSLIQSGTDADLASATGCGCPDGGGCDPSLSGFASQVDCAALTMQQYAEELDTDGVTRAGWRVDVAHATLDPCSVAPANRATAALYTYTPWVGAYSTGCGDAGAGGSTLVAFIYYRYWDAYPWGTDP